MPGHRWVRTTTICAVAFASAAFALAERGARPVDSGPGITQKVPPNDVAALIALFDAYEAGDASFVDAARRLGTALGDPKAFKKTWAASTSSWITAQGSDVELRRSIVAATALLELIRIRLQEAGAREWERIRVIPDDACMLLRRKTPLPIEKSWHQALIALVESVGDFYFLPERPVQGDPDIWNPEHILHARDRFPGDSAWDFAEAMRDEQRSWYSQRDARHPVLVPREVMEARLARHWYWGASKDARATAIPPDGRFDEDQTHRWWSQEQLTTGVLAKNRELWLLARRWRVLTSDRTFGPEARLRLGNTYLRLARPDLAHREFEKAAESGGPFVRYIAWLRGGIYLERVGLIEDAERAYRAALAIAPRAGSASVRLASLLFVHGRSDDAVRIQADAVTQPLAEDPWKAYAAGDPTKWTDAIARIREWLR